MTNSRLNDYFDLSVLLERKILNTDLLVNAITATFERRGMVMPTKLPTGLSDEFAHGPSRQALWRAFIKKSELDPVPLDTIVDQLRQALESALKQAAPRK